MGKKITDENWMDTFNRVHNPGMFKNEKKKTKKIMIVKKHKIKIPEKLCVDMEYDLLSKLYEACIIHEKPLENALGNNYKNI